MECVIILASDPGIASQIAAVTHAVGLSPCIEYRIPVFPLLYDDGFAEFIIFDLFSAPEEDQEGLLRRIQGWQEIAPLVAVGPPGAVPLAVRAIQAGAQDYLEFPFSAERLQGVRSRLRLRPLALPAAPDEALGRLSRRELQVLRRVARGLTNKQIAAELGVSPRTIEVYRASLLEKVQAKNTADLIRFAVSAAVLR